MFIHFVLRLINFVLHQPAKIFYTSLKNFMQAQKFYTGTKKRCSSSLHLFFTGSIEVYVRYRADFLALKKIKVFKKFFAFWLA